MDWVIIGLLVANSLLFAGVGAWGLIIARDWRSPRLRPFGWMIAAVCGAFLLGAVQRLGLQAHRHGLVADSFNDLLLADLQAIKSALSLALGLVGVVLIRRLHGEMRRMGRVVSVLTERVIVDGSVSELGLTPRELQVLEIIGQGALSDQQIAEALHIAPATAKTHVRNVLRKADLTNRRDLLILVQADADESPAR
jgi:DNA-binding CsgD family transcriptional regulator